MVGPIRFDGPVSGIDYTSIIQSLLEVRKRPLPRLQARIDETTARKNALLEINVSLLALKSAADALSRPSFFAATTASSSNPGALTAASTSSAVPGTATFTARRLAQQHQMVSNGFPDSALTPVAAVARTISIEIGGGFLDRRTPVSFLNGQAGFDRGSVRITDSAGRTGLLDLSGAFTVQDVLDEINGAPAFSVRASVAGNRLVVEDRAGGSGALAIADAGPDATATSLGIAGTGVLVGGRSVIFGSDVNTVTGSTPLSLLNDGLGVRRNADASVDFTLTSTSGASVAVNLQAGDLTLQDVLDGINGAGTTISAALAGNALVLVDSAAGDLSIASAADSFAAVDLGLGTIPFAGGFAPNAAETLDGLASGGPLRRIVGDALTPSLNSAGRAQLNGGMTALGGAEPRGVADGILSITDRLGATASVDLSRRVFNAKDAASAGPGATSLALAAPPQGIGVGSRIRVSTSAGVEFRTVTAIGGNSVTFDRALAGSVAAGAGVTGLNGSLEDMVRLINDRAAAAGVGVRVELNREGNGLRVADLTGAAAFALTVAGAPASDLGIAGAVAAAAIEGGDLDVQHLGENTALRVLNGGLGVQAGRFRVIDTNGIQFDVDLTQPGDTTLGSAIRDLNLAAAAAGSAVAARINDTGDGLLLADAAPGAGTLRVQELAGGRTARDLNLAGSAPSSSPAAIDGTFEFRVSVAAGATLQGVAGAVNARGIGVAAAVIRDGSPSIPYRLSLASQRMGLAGRMTVDTDIAGLSFSTAVAAQDAVLLYGAGGSGAEPAAITSASNTVSGAVPGLTLELHGPSTAPITVSVTRDTGAVVGQAQRLADSYNEVVGRIRELTVFNPETAETGLLFTDPAVRRVRRELASLVVAPVAGLPSSDLNALAEVGFRTAADGALAFDSGAFSSALQADFEGVRNLFILQRRLDVSTPLGDLNNGLGVGDAAGDDFTVTTQDGSTFAVDIAGASTVGAVLLRINAAPGNGGRVTAGISADGFSIELLDLTTGPTPFSVQNVGNATAATRLKIAKTLPAGQNVLRGDIIGLQGDPGAAARLSERLDFVTRSGDGLLPRRADSLDESVEDLQESIRAIEERAKALEESLIRRFSRLETVIARSQSTSQRLSLLLTGVLGASSPGGFAF